MAAKICRVCLEDKFKNFSISEEVIGKDLSTVIENVIGQGVSKLESDFLVCQECVAALIQAESIAAKLRRALDKKEATNKHLPTPTETTDKKRLDSNKTNDNKVKRNCRVKFIEGKLTLICEHCGYETDNVKCFKKHLLNKHQTNDPRIFQCPKCDVAYQRQYALESHIACLHENQPRTIQRRKSMLLEKSKSNHHMKAGPSEIPKALSKSSNPLTSLMKNISESDSDESDGVQVLKSIVDIAKSKHQMKTGNVSGKSPKSAKTPNTTAHNTSESETDESDEGGNFQSIIDIAKSVHQLKSVTANKPKDSPKTPTASKNSQPEISESDKKAAQKSLKVTPSKTATKKSTTKFIFNCEHCSFQTTKAADFRKHLTAEHKIDKPRIFKCSKCPSSFQGKQSLDKHVANTHEEQQQQRKSVSSNSDDLATPNLKRNHAEQEHSQGVHSAPAKGANKRKNDVSDVETPVSSNKKRARLTKLGQESAKSETQKQTKLYSPQDNGDIFMAEKQKNVKTYQCNICSFEVESKKELRKHSAEHAASESGPFKCPHCSETYQREFMLQVHVFQAHMNASPGKIVPTGKTSPTKVKKSSPARELQKCVVCGKNFANLAELRVHTDKCHLGSSTRSCPHCGGSFNSSEKYEKHTFSEKCLKWKLQCQYSLCKKRFSKPSKLERHMSDKHPIDVNMEGDDSE